MTGMESLSKTQANKSFTPILSMFNGKGKMGSLSQHTQRCHVCIITRQSMLPTRVLFAVVQSLSRVQLCTPWTVAYQASLSFTNSRSLL